MNKVTRQTIRKLVLEEISGMRKPQRRSLASYLFEDTEAAKAIAAAAKGGPGDVRKLANSYSNKEELKKALQGSFDDVATDDTVTVGGASNRKVGDFIPTQKEIDLMKSVGYPLGGFDSLKKMITSKTSTAPGSISVSGNEVLDGHHRWSGVWGIVGSKGEISTQDLGFTGNTAQKLAQAQLAIAAYKKPDLPHPSAAEPIPYNIMGSDGPLPKVDIKKMILDNVGVRTDPEAPGPLLNDDVLDKASKSKVVADWAGFDVGADKETVKDKIADKVADNLSTLPANGNAPPREDMPQFDHKSMGEKQEVKAAIYAGLEGGNFNVNAPFAPSGGESKNESRFRHDNVILERWQKLAGLIKD